MFEHGRNDRERGRCRRLLFLGTLLLAGCRGVPAELFDPVDPPIVWPPAPGPARISYVGQVTSSADLRPARSFAQRVQEFLAGAEAPSDLYGPRSAVRTSDGSRLWVADPGGRCLHLFDLERRTYAQVTRLGDQRLLSPVGLCLGPAQTLYVCDSEAAAVYALDSRTGALQGRVAGAGELHRPAAVSFVASRDELFVVDCGAHDVKVFAPDGDLLRVLGRRGSGPGELNYPCDVAAADGFLWISDAGNHRVQALTYEGEYRAEIGRAGDAPGDLALPKGVAVDEFGHVYVVDARFENVQIFDPSGQLLLFFGEEGSGPGEFWLPSDVFIDEQNWIWVCDSYNRRIQVFELHAEGVSDVDADV